MSPDHTQQQSSQEQQRARQLSMHSTVPPVDVPGYEAQSRLGSGAFGEVWIGTDKKTSRRVAIKFFMHRSGLDWTQLSREVEKLVLLSTDRYVVQLLDVGWESDPPYYIMEYIENGSLEDLLREQGQLNVRDADEIFREIAIGLMHAHGKGVLHCDLKPANILLDLDNKPRLADFGQSRLSHEQSPALGTLFYMAPEQADLKAVPDSCWDVYALGALLYCMLTGSPPHRSEAATGQLDSASGLADRLAKYRKLIAAAPAPAEHRRAARVDRPLADIVDRCLAFDPQRRFPNVQAVIDALNARDTARLRRPLMLIGFVGPILLLTIMAIFGMRGYERAVRQSESLVTIKARENNVMTARLAASSIEGEIYRYFVLIEREASQAAFQTEFNLVAKSDIVKNISDPDISFEERAGLRSSFSADETRQALNDYLQRRLDDHLRKLNENESELKIASFLVVDASGRMLAVAYDHDEPSRSIGWNYAYRTYFHGGPADLQYENQTLQQYEQTPRGIEPIRKTHFSAAFRSTTTGLWKIAVSTPIFRDESPESDVVGVLGMTVNLGDFAYFRNTNLKDRFAVLIDGRRGPNQGVILQHPLFDIMGQDGKGPAEDHSATEFRVTEAQLEGLQPDSVYRDPLGETSEGELYRGDWIASTANVSLPAENSSNEGIVVLVQERKDKATAPVKELGGQLKREGLWALGGVIGVVIVLWYIALRMMVDPRSSVWRAAANGPAASGTTRHITNATPSHNLTTLPAPPRQEE
ncbi:MAG TPA: protein kinase [Pirellulaceae bacterium]|nr:protein kinase [Pirellulaceae bacterium]